jgi:hypothetical protein
MALAKGQVIGGRYRIVSLLGQGGMGAVYRTWDTRLNVPVALKEMTPQPGIDVQTLAQLRQQFEREANTLARLSHPHLVDVTDYFEEGDNTYLVMKFVEGESLADWIAREGLLPERQVLAWAGQLLDALVYCHGEGVIHRDVKPQNVVITPKGQAVLVDFGLVKLWDPNDPRTQTAMRGMGTPEYAPPEQYDAHMGYTDARSDIYGVGATLYHALTGQPPPTVTMRIVNPDALAPVRALAPGVGKSTEAAVARALELQPSARFQSAQEMTGALGVGAVVAEPTAPQRQPTGVMAGARPAVLLRRRVPGWVWALAGLAPVVAVALAVRGWQAPATVPTMTPAPTVTPVPSVASLATLLPTATLTPIPTVTPSPTPTVIPIASETMDSLGNVGQESSLALDNSGIPYIVYRDITNDSLKYAVLSGATWVSGTVETSVGQLGPSLALDDSGSLHVAYTHRGPYVNYAVLRGATWVIETAAKEPAAEPSLALDSSGNPRIAYCGMGVLKYAYRTASGWVTEDFAYVPCGNPGVEEALPSLELDSSGTPHIAYCDVANSSMKYTVLRGTTWVSETVETPVGQTDSHLVLDGSDNPHLAYSYSGFVKYAVLRGTSWVVEAVDDAGAAPSLALDSSGNPHIAYCAVVGEGLKYAYWTGSEWVKVNVDATMCNDPSLVLDGSDNPHISYYDAVNSDLKYVHWVVSRPTTFIFPADEGSLVFSDGPLPSGSIGGGVCLWGAVEK